jgi:hypothetical protein
MTGRLAPWRLFGMAAPMGVWALHFVFVYSLVGLACAEGWPAIRMGGVRLLTWTMLGSTVLALALIGGLGLRAWRARQCVSANGENATPARVLDRHRFMTLVSSVLALVAFIAVVFTSTPMFMLSTCT